jgi:hypothetical protein
MFLGSLTGHVVPEIGKRYGEKGWRQALRDWERADPQRNHTVPLREWPHEWRTAKANAQQFHNREVIANAFWGSKESGGFEGDEHEFCKTYPAHQRGITVLVKEITVRRVALGFTKSRTRRR